MRDVWVDYNDLDRNGVTTTLARHAESTANLSVGAVVLTGDDEGNVCKGTILATSRGILTIALDLQKFRPVGHSVDARSWAS